MLLLFFSFVEVARISVSIMTTIIIIWGSRRKALVNVWTNVCRCLDVTILRPMFTSQLKQWRYFTHCIHHSSLICIALIEMFLTIYINSCCLYIDCPAFECVIRTDRWNIPTEKTKHIVEPFEWYANEFPFEKSYIYVLRWREDSQHQISLSQTIKLV